MFFVPNGIVSVEERREHLQQERDKAIEQLKANGTVTPRINAAWSSATTILCFH
jgi:hypothetical protein